MHRLVQRCIASLAQYGGFVTATLHESSPFIYYCSINEGNFAYIFWKATAWSAE